MTIKTFNPNKYGLAFHTTTPQLGISIGNFVDNNRSQVWDLGRDLSVYLHQSLGEFLQPQTWQDLEFIAVAKGPGGFTGTRIGVVAARTLAQQLDIPLYGVSSLAAVALAYVNTSKEILAENNNQNNYFIAVQMKARQEQFFVAIYRFLLQDNSLQTYLPDTIMTIEEWQKTLSNLKQPYQLIKAPNNLADTVTSVLELAYQQWQKGRVTSWLEVLPFYGQHPV
ncbi:MAG: tRNA (adenosine(37)-N6)-threonylcarbamoyltransferase complex dimerization subunit type 1 TsaB [Xenococcaceae cyanobacterium MO_188.B32]|nr:tRNA (adenosine(37)-N6)-threonylcarbamoyltransferase complex dimerization subunit type 1 TsaB [Xenococcaceae cyanobacterium MO_188.B32]